MSDALSIILIFGVWYLLNKIILPKLGVPT